MLYDLKRVADHPYYLLIELPRFFFEKAVDANQFAIDLFPSKYHLCIQKASGKQLKLGDLFEEVFEELEPLNKRERKQVLAVFENHNSIAQLCENTKARIKKLPAKADGLHDKLYDLFVHLYEDTKKCVPFRTATGETKEKINGYISEFRAKNDLEVCPYCGLHEYPVESEGNPSLDHYLCKDTYPMAGVNFDNLVPICDSCNGPSIKGRKDVLRKGSRRPTLFPFSNPPHVSVKVSCLRQPSLDDVGKWAVKLDTSATSKKRMLNTWRDVFSIDQRYKDHLDKSATLWLKEILPSCVDVDFDKAPVTTMKKKFESQAVSYMMDCRKIEKSRLKAAYFKYLAEQSDKPSIQGIVAILKSNYAQTTQSRADELLSLI